MLDATIERSSFKTLLKIFCKKIVSVKIVTKCKTDLLGEHKVLNTWMCEECHQSFYNIIIRNIINYIIIYVTIYNFMSRGHLDRCVIPGEHVEGNKR